MSSKQTRTPSCAMAPTLTNPPPRPQGHTPHPDGHPPPGHEQPRPHHQHRREHQHPTNTNTQQELSPAKSDPSSQDNHHQNGTPVRLTHRHTLHTHQPTTPPLMKIVDLT